VAAKVLFEERVVGPLAEVCARDSTCLIVALLEFDCQELGALALCIPKQFYFVWVSHDEEVGCVALSERGLAVDDAARLEVLAVRLSSHSL